jgi:hypothetical protein
LQETDLKLAQTAFAHEVDVVTLASRGDGPFAASHWLRLKAMLRKSKERTCIFTQKATITTND